MLTEYPRVIGEFETVRKICKGFSIGRIGDGELKIMDGKGYVREVANPKLTEEVKQLCVAPNDGCIVGIPTMDPAGTKYHSFVRHTGRFLKFLGNIRYYSALISRPDCGAWLETLEYALHVQKIWLGKKRVAIVSEPDNKLLTNVRKTNAVDHVPCPMYGAYAFIDQFERDVLKLKPDVALLSIGPTATCLANRLAGHGIQAVDLGSIGGFLSRWL